MRAMQQKQIEPVKISDAVYIGHRTTNYLQQTDARSFFYVLQALALLLNMKGKWILYGRFVVSGVDVVEYLKMALITHNLCF